MLWYLEYPVKILYIFVRCIFWWNKREKEDKITRFYGYCIGYCFLTTCPYLLNSSTGCFHFILWNKTCCLSKKNCHWNEIVSLTVIKNKNVHYHVLFLVSIQKFLDFVLYEVATQFHKIYIYRYTFHIFPVEIFLGVIRDIIIQLHVFCYRQSSCTYVNLCFTPSFATRTCSQKDRALAH